MMNLYSFLWVQYTELGEAWGMVGVAAAVLATQIRIRTGGTPPSFDRVWLEAPHSTPSFLAEAKSRKILLCHEKDSVTDTVLPLPRFPVVDPACHIDSNRYAEIVPICYDTISQNQGKSSSDGEL